MIEGLQEVPAEQGHPAEHGHCKEVEGVAHGQAGVVPIKNKVSTNITCLQHSE